MCVFVAVCCLFVCCLFVAASSAAAAAAQNTYYRVAAIQTADGSFLSIISTTMQCLYVTDRLHLALL